MTFKLFGTDERTYWKTIFESSTGGTGASNWVDLGQVENVRYKIWAVGGGGGGSNSWNDSTPSESACAGGGSGGYAYVLFDNRSGQSSGGNISVFVGQGGASAYTTGYWNNITAGNGVESSVRFPKISQTGGLSLLKIVTANGGTGGETGMDRYGTAGSGGTAIVNTSVFTFVENSAIDGKSGTAFGSSYGTAIGGESLYLGHGKGGNAGPAAAVESGVSGYVRIDKESDASDYTYMEEKITNIKLANDFGVMKGYKEPTSSGGVPEHEK